MRASWPLIRLLTGLLGLLFAGVFGVPASASAVTPTCTYDTSAYTYDAPVRLSPPDTVATDAWGSVSGPRIALGVSHLSAAWFGVAANTAGGGAETFFRTMSKENFAELQATGRVPATSETFISPPAGFSSAYEGQMVQLSVRPGTTSSLASMGVRDGSAAASSAFPNMPLVSSGWTSTSAFFKGEGGVVNIGLGRGSALNTFNDSILSWQAVP